MGDPRGGEGGGRGDRDSHSKNMNAEDFTLAHDEAEELKALDETLDQLDSCVSILEERSDNLNAKIREFLEESRQERASEQARAEQN
ncbi:UPF0184 protein-like [Ptychodera flava]|uniref:UPF0184 protein-like n=1 Tax=Ptychodera flava TaxID=63121 RepID=UPI003969D602